jgi:hypothetical protein
MWGFVKGLADSVRNVITGVLSLTINLIKVVIHRLIGLIELLTSLLGIMPRKKLRVRVHILHGNDLNPIATRRLVKDSLDIAKKVFKDEANVDIVAPVGGHELIITDVADAAPGFAMRPSCDAVGYRQIFSRVGRWFRQRLVNTPQGALFGYGMPANIFIVQEVIGKVGCFLWLANYGYVSIAGLKAPATTLAHELGHSCDLPHRDGTLMHPSTSGRQLRLTRWQRAWLRSSSRVTYL